jgi:hypothetical protein
VDFPAFGLPIIDTNPDRIRLPSLLLP